MTPRIGTSQSPRGTRKGRSRSGSRRRSTMTPMQTRANAKRVPMLVSCTISSMLAIAAKTPTKTPVRIVVTHGVRYFGCTAPKNDSGNSPSRAIASHTRGWLSIITSSTEVMPVIAPVLIRKRAHGRPARPNASETGVSMLIWL